MASIIETESELSTFWLPVWEDRNQKSFREACRAVARECQADIEVALGLLRKKDDLNTFPMILEKLGGFAPDTRGSGTKSAIISAIHCWVFKDQSVLKALLEMSNLIGTDTDTIATMSGAVLGILTDENLEMRICDRDYLIAEAKRCWAIKNSRSVLDFNYPDLLNWKSPKTQGDALLSKNEYFYIAGLGDAKPMSDLYVGQGKKPGIWQWVLLDYGQLILCKRRNELSLVPNSQITSNVKLSNVSNDASQPELFSNTPVKEQSVNNYRKIRNIDDLTDEVIAANFSPEIIGQNFLELAHAENSIEKAIAYSSILAKALASRNKRK